MHKLSKTTSICPTCLKDITADIVEDKGKVYLQKKCGKHGIFKAKIFNSYKHYSQYMEFYNALSPKGKNYNNHSAYPMTNACNQKCPICFVDTHKKDEKIPTIKDVQKFIKQNPKVGRINLFGGEPTIRDDLVKIIELIKEHKISTTLVTNGIRISKINYLRELKRAGLDAVFLQFDGFNEKTDKILRGELLIKTRIKALNNLLRLKIPTLLEVTCAEGINDSGYSRIIDLVNDYPNIKGISFRSYCQLGKKHLDQNACMTVDEIIKVVEKETKARISLKEVMHFQKLFLIASDIFQIQNCSYMLFYMITKNKKTNKWRPLSHHLDLSKINKQLKTYLDMRNKGKVLSRLYLFSCVLPRLLSLKNFRLVITEVLKNLRNLISKRNYSLTDTNNVILTFEGACDVNTFDYSVVEHCRGYYVHPEDLSVDNTGMSNLKREKALMKP